MAHIQTVFHPEDGEDLKHFKQKIIILNSLHLKPKIAFEGIIRTVTQYFPLN